MMRIPRPLGVWFDPVPAFLGKTIRITYRGVEAEVTGRLVGEAFHWIELETEKGPLFIARKEIRNIREEAKP